MRVPYDCWDLEKNPIPENYTHCHKGPTICGMRRVLGHLLALDSSTGVGYCLGLRV